MENHVQLPLCQNYKVFYINGTWAPLPDVEVNCQYLTDKIFKDSNDFQRVEILFNDNTDCVNITETTLEKVMQKLLDVERSPCKSKNITAVFLGHSFAATILRHALSEDVLSKEIQKQCNDYLNSNRLVEIVRTIRDSIAVFSVAGTKLVPRNQAKIAVNIRNPKDVVMDFYKIVIRDDVEKKKCNIFGKVKYKNPIAISVRCAFNYLKNDNKSHHFTSYLKDIAWQDYMLKTFQLDNNKTPSCGCGSK